MSDSIDHAKLNAIAAQRVLGLVPCGAWKPINFGSAGGPMLKNDGCEHECGKCYPITTIGSMHGEIGGCPKFTTSISDAWRLVEALASRGMVVTAGWEGHSWWCDAGELDDEGYVDWLGVIETDTQPLAITIVALRASGVSNDALRELGVDCQHESERTE